MSNVTNNYSHLFGSTVKATTAPSLPAANTPVVNTPVVNTPVVNTPITNAPVTNAPTVPAQTVDAMTFSAQAANSLPVNNTTILTATAAPVANQATTVASPEDLKKELQRLQQELAAINTQIEAVMKAIDASSAQKTTTVLSTQPTAAAGGSYKVSTGDYLWKIAKEQLGDAKRWTEIYELNKDAIGSNPNLIYPGQILKLPGAQTTPTQIVDPAPPVNNTPVVNTPVVNTPVVNTPVVNTPVVNTPVVNTPVVNTPVVNTPPATDKTDVPAPPASNRNLSDQDVARIAQDFGLAPDRANVTAFLDEMDSYEGASRGQVFGPGMESIAANDTERTQIQQSVMQIQQALAMLIKAGKLKPVNAQGQAVTDLPLTGNYFKVDAQGKELKDAQGNPVMDDAFIGAITQFKQDNQIHQAYKLSDGSFGINEYIGPTTIEALKQALATLPTS